MLSGAYHLMGILPSVFCVYAFVKASVDRDKPKSDILIYKSHNELMVKKFKSRVATILLETSRRGARF